VQRKKKVNVMKCLKHVALLSSILLMATASLSASASDDHCVSIYYDGSDASAVRYVQTLEQTIKSTGVTNIAKYDYSTDGNALRDLRNLHNMFDVPTELFNSVTTFVDAKYVFEGFIPANTIVNFIGSNPGLDKLVAAQGPSSDKYTLRQDDLTIECDSSQGILDSLTRAKTLNQQMTLAPYLALVCLVAIATILVVKKLKH
jgi:hypothetical protein